MRFLHAQRRALHFSVECLQVRDEAFRPLQSEEHGVRLHRSKYESTGGEPIQPSGLGSMGCSIRMAKDPSWKIQQGVCNEMSSMCWRLWNWAVCWMFQVWVRYNGECTVWRFTMLYALSLWRKCDLQCLPQRLLASWLRIPQCQAIKVQKQVVQHRVF